MYYPLLEEFREKAGQGNLIPVYKEIVADMETPVSALQKINNSDYAFLLESVEGGEHVGRYSFLGSGFSTIFQSKADIVTITKNGKQEQLKGPGDPLEKLKKLMLEHKPVQTPELRRFHGGAVGFLSYDIVRHFEKLPDSAEDDRNIPDCMFMLTDTILVFDRVKHTIKIISNAHVDKDGVDAAYGSAISRIEDIITTLKKPFQSKSMVCPFKVERKLASNFNQSEYEKVVLKAKKYIRAGDIIQVVPSQRLSTPVSADAFDIYRALRIVNPSPYMYYLKFGDELQIVGSSPEMMVRVEDSLVQLRPIAGTCPRGETEAEDLALEKELLADPKELAEHVMLVDLGRNDLGRVCEYGSVTVNENEMMIIERYSHVMHIVSNMQGKLRADKDAFDVIRACLPAGTLSGAPKIRAMEIIDELEPTRRGPYGGAVGYFSSSGNCDTGITIRTIVIKNGIAYVQAGGGIVADSVPEKEYQETLDKAKAPIKAIEMAEEGLK